MNVNLHQRLLLLLCIMDYNYMTRMYGIMTEELVICEIRIDEATGRGDSDSRMTSFEVIMPLKLQSTKI